VSSITIISDDATIWSVTYYHHYGDRNSFIIQATGLNGSNVMTFIFLSLSNKLERLLSNNIIAWLYICSQPQSGILSGAPLGLGKLIP